MSHQQGTGHQSPVSQYENAWVPWQYLNVSEGGDVPQQSSGEFHSADNTPQSASYGAHPPAQSYPASNAQGTSYGQQQQPSAPSYQADIPQYPSYGAQSSAHYPVAGGQSYQTNQHQGFSHGAFNSPYAPLMHGAPGGGIAQMPESAYALNPAGSLAQISADAAPPSGLHSGQLVPHTNLSSSTGPLGLSDASRAEVAASLRPTVGTTQRSSRRPRPGQIPAGAANPSGLHSGQLVPHTTQRSSRGPIGLPLAIRDGEMASPALGQTVGPTIVLSAASRAEMTAAITEREGRCRFCGSEKHRSS